MMIDWVKVSELIFGAALQGFIGAIIVLITFRLGQLESEKVWERELQQKLKEQQTEKVVRCIDAIQTVIELYSIFELRISSGTPFAQEELAKIKPTLTKARATLEQLQNANLNYCLRGAGYLSISQSDPESREIEKRLAIFNKVFDGLKAELIAIESRLASTLESVGSWQ